MGQKIQRIREMIEICEKKSNSESVSLSAYFNLLLLDDINSFKMEDEKRKAAAFKGIVK